jgi:hypothetical protein
MDGRTERHADERMLGRHGTKRQGLSELDTRAKNLAWAEIKKINFVEFCESVVLTVCGVAVCAEVVDGS